MFTQLAAPTPAVCALNPEKLERTEHLGREAFDIENTEVIFVYPGLQVNYLRSHAKKKKELLCCSSERLSTPGGQRLPIDWAACEIIQCNNSIGLYHRCYYCLFTAADLRMRLQL